MAKLIAWDLECSNLNASFGYILCAGYKELGSNKTHVISITDFKEDFQRDPTNDRNVVKAIADVLSKADMWITWYGGGFDIPYLNSRLLYHKLPVLPRVPHVDGWRVARGQMKMHSNRLASVSSFLGVEEKTPLNGPIWIRASAGHKPSIKYVVQHCRQDVVVLEQVYNIIKPLAITHPNVGLMNGLTHACPKCGIEGKMQKRGSYVAKTRVCQRVHCQNCGSWSRFNKTESEPVATYIN